MRSLIKPVFALAVATGLMAANAAPASADYWGHGPGFAAGVAAGIIGLGIIGAEAARDRPYYGAACYPGPLECHMVEPPCFHNENGDYVCPRPERRCFHRQYCD